MSQLLLLPSHNEWKQLDILYRKLNKNEGLSAQQIADREKTFGFFNPILISQKDFFYPTLTDNYAKFSRLLIYLSRDFWNNCPSPLLNIIKECEGDTDFTDFFLGDYEVISPIFGGKDKKSEFNRTSILRFLTVLENENIIQSYSYKSWLQKYGVQGEIKENKDFMERSSAKIYPLTGLGTILYEYIINTPLMFQPYLSTYFANINHANGQPNILTRSQNRYNTTANPLVTLSISTRSERLSLFLNSPFHYKDRKDYAFHSYHEEIGAEQSRLLGNQLDFFVHIHNPATKILREIKCLKDLIEYYDLSISNLSKRKVYQSHELIPIYLKKKIANDIEFLEDIWTNQLGLNLNLIKLHLPEITI